MSNGSDNLVEVLKDIRRWIKFSNLGDARSKLYEAILEEDNQKEKENKIIFYLSNGERSGYDIAEFVSVTPRTVSNRQKEWAEMGLMEKLGPSRPYRKLISLEEVGLGVPDIPELKSEK